MGPALHGPRMRGGGALPPRSERRAGHRASSAAPSGSTCWQLPVLQALGSLALCCRLAAQQRHHGRGALRMRSSGFCSGAVGAVGPHGPAAHGRAPGCVPTREVTLKRNPNPNLKHNPEPKP